MKGVRELPFRGFYIGAVASALFFSYGIESAVATASDPLTAGISAVVNRISQSAHLEVLPLRTAMVPWLIACDTGVSAIVAVALALWVGAWVRRKSVIQR